MNGQMCYKIIVSNPDLFSKIMKHFKRINTVHDSLSGEWILSPSPGYKTYRQKYIK